MLRRTSACFSITMTFTLARANGRPIVAHWFSRAGPNSVGAMSAFLNWWDGNELWLSGLAFVLQAMVVMPVVLAAAYVTAALLEGLLGKGIEVMRRARHADGTSG
jgi:hypothetical protein